MAEGQLDDSVREDNSALLDSVREDNSALLDSVREDNSALLDQYTDCARKFIDLVKDLDHIKGASKLQRMCRSELKYLQTLKKFSGAEVCGNHLKSSNLGHFAGCIHAAYNAPGVVQILSPFAMDGRSENLVVDVVANQGQTWVKVIARKAQALHLIWAGRGQFGERDLVKQAKDYLRCSSHHPINFQTPKVHFAFYNQVTVPMAECLEQLGISVSGERVAVDEGTANQISLACVSSSDEEDSEESSSESESNESVLQQERLSGLSGAHQDKQACFKHSGDLNCDTNTATKSWQIAKNVQLFNEMALLDSLVGSLPQFECLSESFTGTNSPSSLVIEKVNLDITTLITLVSSVTNGGCHFEFSEKVLAQQAAEERREPVLPKLKQFLHEILAIQRNTRINQSAKPVKKTPPCNG
ncbi:UPF0415 protein C7orf25 homolog isoform X2 [Crassostrea virginica]